MPFLLMICNSEELVISMELMVNQIVASVPIFIIRKTINEQHLERNNVNPSAIKVFIFKTEIRMRHNIISSFLIYSLSRRRHCNVFSRYQWYRKTGNTISYANGLYLI